MADTFDPTTATDDQIDQYVRETYPNYGPFMDIPEIRSALINAAKNSYDQARFQSEIEKTQWWKEHGSSARNWFALVSQDPASAKQQRDQMKLKLRNLAGSLGAVPNDQQLNGDAEFMLTYGYNDDQMKEYVAQQYRNTYHGQGVKGSVDDTKTQLQGLANDYLMAYDDGTMTQWATQLFSGQTTIESIRGFMAQQSAAMHPSMKDAIDRGLTPKQFMAPVTKTVADTLEMSSDQVNLLDPRYSALWQTPTDKGTRPMTVAEAGNWARSQKEWRYTDNARQKAEETSAGLLKAMGAMA